jgi:ATP-binding protein involved in chromosome partitioning
MTVGEDDPRRDGSPRADPREDGSRRGGSERSPAGLAADGSGGLATLVRESIRDAEVGREELFAGIADLGGITGVEVRDGTAEVVVGLPVPSAEVREAVERGIADAVSGVEGVERVSVVWRADPRDAGERVELVPGVRNVVAVASGKGGVGKSTVAVNLAVALADAGAAVGLLDADVYGPNAPTMLGLGDRSVPTNADDEMVPPEAHGVKVMSMGFVAGEEDPVIWRGPLVDEFLKQLLGDVSWGPLDYLVVDLPPGTGDAQLSLVQNLPVAGAVIVTTPQEVAVDDAARGLTGFARYDVPVLGVVENMAWFRCPDCGEVHEPFGEGGGETLAAEFEVPVLGRLPLDPLIDTLDEDEETTPPGVSVPLVGRLQLPRTRAEREREGRRPPIAVRTGDSEAEAVAREAFRLMATKVAARVNEAAVWRSGNGTEV